MGTIIEVNQAVKRYRETTALDGVTLSFEKNKIHGIIGRNGSGKTVLFKCITGLTHLSSGSIKVMDKVIGKDVQIPKNIGAIIETPGFINEFSGIKNLLFLASINRKIKKEQVEEAMRFVGLDPKSKKRVSKYSLGMRQRLGIAQAVMENPEILILDEPTNGLDKKGVEEFREYMLKLKGEGKTILIASHNAEDIRYLCDTVCELDQGKLV